MKTNEHGWPELKLCTVEELREALRIVGFRTCDEHLYEGWSGDHNEARATLAFTLALIADQHLRNAGGLPNDAAGSVHHNVGGMLGWHDCDDEHHANTGCCGVFA